MCRVSQDSTGGRLFAALGEVRLPEEQGWQGRSGGQEHPDLQGLALQTPSDSLAEEPGGCSEALLVPCSHQTLLRCRPTPQVLLKELERGDPRFLLMPLGLIKSPARPHLPQAFEDFAPIDCAIQGGNPVVHPARSVHHGDLA